MTDPTGPRLLAPKIIEPYSTCSSCIETLDDFEWLATTTVLVGEWALGIRASDAATDAAIRAVLAAHVIAMDAPANFSALMADTSGTAGTGRSFNFLYRASDPLVRTRAPGRLLHALLQYLSDFAEPATDRVGVAATAFIVDGGAIVAPEWLRPELPNIESRLNAAGIAVIDAPVVHIDPVSGGLEVPEPALTLDARALAEFDAAPTPARRELPAVGPGRYPIIGWALTSDPEVVVAPRPAQAVAAAAQQVVNGDAVGAQVVLDTLAGVLTSIPVAGLWWQEPAVLAAGIVRLAGAAANPSRAPGHRP